MGREEEAGREERGRNKNPPSDRSGYGHAVLIILAFFCDGFSLLLVLIKLVLPNQ